MDPGEVPTVNWESSSPPRPKPGMLDTPFSEKTPRRVGVPRLPPSSENATSDPVDDLLGKYHVNPLRSSPPPTWPIPQAKPAQKFNSETAASRKLNRAAVRLYSPGYLKRPRTPTPLTPLRPSKAPSVGLALEDDDTDNEIDWTQVRIPCKETTAPPLLFDDDDDDDLDLTSLIPLKSEPLPPIYPQLDEPVIKYSDSPLEIVPLSRDCLRLLVEVVLPEPTGTVLMCKGLNGPRKVVLQDSWRQLSFEKNDVIHIIGKCDGTDEVVVSHATQNLLVLNPDTLVACTAIADSLRCERQVVIRSRLRTPTDGTIPMVYGMIIHELIQLCLLENRLSLTDMEKLLEESVIDAYVEDLTILEVDVKTALAEIKERLPKIAEWASQIVCEGKPVFKASIHRSTRELPIKITATHLVEEEIWSPTYGLKGKIDATVAVSTGGANLATALEIKTGNISGFSSTPHRAQVMLYQLLLRERYDKVLPWVLIYYAKESAMIAVRGMPDETRQLIMRRNVLVRHINRPGRLPWHTHESNDCNYCARKNDCTVFTAAYDENKDEENSNMAIAQRLVAEAPAKWTAAQLAFFRHWERLLVYEDLETNKTTRDVWCMDAESREGLGKALADVRVMLTATQRNVVKSTFTYICTRDKPFPEFDQTYFNVRCPIIVSSPRAVAEAIGYIDRLTPEEAVIVVNRELADDIRYRIDHEDTQAFLSFSKYNLLQMFVARPRMLDLIVDLKPPTFTVEPVYALPANLNSDQRAAVSKTAAANDYTLILGMPGTGKTTTIVSIVEMLLAQGKTVLISAATHSAVDNIVLKLMKKDVDVLRIGSLAKFNPQVARMMAARAAKVDPAANASERLKQLYFGAPVVAATCLTTNNWLFTRRHFDYCIIDEASQITLPTCLGPIRFADRFVLVGDHYQLQPIVRSPTAMANGFGESLFKRLCDAHPSAVANLSHQYRMNEDIMNLSSTLIYNGMLKCGSKEVANQKLTLPKKIHFAPTWLQPVLDPSNSVVFLNTDSSGAPEEERPEGMANPKEAKIVEAIVKYLIESGGIAEAQLGVISVYRAQLRLLKECLRRYKNLDVLTADQAQGRDKDCIIMSLVRSNDDQKVGTLLKDWRRINVCFTRAKSKLIVVGSRKTLTYASPLEKFLKVIEANGWIWNA